MAHEDIKYEQACILYNLGELPDPFHLALPPNLSSAGGPKGSADGEKTSGF